MKFILTYLLALLCPAIAVAQTSTAKRLFADTEPIIKKFRADSQKAWDAKNDNFALSYDDSIKACITGTYVGNHQFKTLNNKVIDTRSLKKPVLVTVSADWCAPCRAEIPALNKIAEEYKDKVDLVVLFWNDAEETQKLAPQYNKLIFIVPSATKSDEEGGHKIAIDGFTHVMGYPTNYMINTGKQIVKYESGAAVAGSWPGPDGKIKEVTEADALDINYKRLKADVEFLLAHNN